jgi:hypothetical protein
MKRPAIVFCIDVLASLIVLAWYLHGPWVDLYGFSVFRNRLGEWVPRPATAIDYIHGLVFTGVLLFVAFFLLTSLVSCSLARPRFLYNAFDGEAPQLIVKYLAFLLSSILAAYFYNYLWRFRGTRLYRVSIGLALTVATFVFLILAGDWSLARSGRRRRSTPV